MKKKINQVQNELEKLDIEGQSGGGMVKATVNGKMELLNLDLQNEIFEEDKDLIEDLIISAIKNDMARHIEQAIANKFPIVY